MTSVLQIKTRCRHSHTDTIFLCRQFLMSGFECGVSWDRDKCT